MRMAIEDGVSAHTGERAQAPIFFVVPAFNEEANLPRLFADLERFDSEVPGTAGIVVVDDGSVDNTPALVEAYDGSLPVKLVRLEKNQGPGAAFRRGFNTVLDECNGDALIVTLEADTTSDLRALPAMLGRATEGADLVLASVHGGGRMVNVNLLRRALSKAAGSITRAALGLDAATVSSFYRVYRASILRLGFAEYGESLIRERGFACKAELLAKLGRLGARVEEVPVELDGSKRVGESKMQIGPTLAGYWRLIVRQRLAKGAAA
jgi:dolichol-phosphate mannosyltransferase